MAVVNGDPAWCRHATGVTTAGGTFDHWTIHAGSNPEIEARCAAWVRRNLRGYTGMLNVETIGGTIIEAHLRFSDQWPDLYGAGWVEALVGLYSNRAWRFPDADRRDGFSVILFAPHGRRYRHPTAELIESVKRIPSVSSIQIPFHEGRAPEDHAMPPGGFRVAIVNAWDLEGGRVAREQLATHFLSDAPLGGIRAIG